MITIDIIFIFINILSLFNNQKQVQRAERTGHWGTDRLREEQESFRRKEFVDSKLAHLQARIRIQAAAYRVSLTIYSSLIFLDSPYESYIPQCSDFTNIIKHQKCIKHFFNKDIQNVTVILRFLNLNTHFYLPLICICTLRSTTLILPSLANSSYYTLIFLVFSKVILKLHISNESHE